MSDTDRPRTLAETASLYATARRIEPATPPVRDAGGFVSHPNGRWYVHSDGDGLIVCFGEHAPDAKCEYLPFEPVRDAGTPHSWAIVSPDGMTQPRTQDENVADAERAHGYYTIVPLYATPPAEVTVTRGIEAGMIALWRDDADKIERWMNGAISTYDRRTLDLVKAVRALADEVERLAAALSARTP